MKNFIKIIFLSLILLSFGYSSTLKGYETNKEYRLKEIKKIIQKENQIVSMVENYIFLTGDTTVDTNKLINFFKLDPDFFKGIKNNISVKIENGMIVIENELESNGTVNQETLDLYNRYKNKTHNSYIKGNDVYIQLSENSKKAINFLNSLPDDYTVVNSTNENNTDVTKKRLEYNGNGFKISKFDTNDNKWTDLGYFDFNNKKGIMVNNEKDLISLGKIKNVSAYVLDDNKMEELKYSDSGWQPISSTGGNFFIGDGTIFDAACKIYNYDGGSRITINPDKEQYIDTVENFTKVDVSNENGYWVNDNKNMLIIKDISDTKYKDNYNTNINQMFICSPNGLSYYVLKNEYINNSKLWVIELNTMQDMLNFNGDYFNNQWFFVKDLNIYFQKINDIFYSKYKLLYNNFISFNEYIVGAGTRDIFNNITLEDDKTYLTTLDDCVEKKNCSGSLPTIFGGEKIDGLYKWTDINGELQDVVSSNLIDAYNNSYNYFYDNTRNTYFKKVIDNNGNICYQNTNDQKIYLENGNILDQSFIDNENNIIIPLNTLTCKNNLNNSFGTGTFKNYMNVNVFSKYIKLDNLNQLINWNTNSLLTNVIINNKLFSFKNNQWQSYNTVFAIGDRNNLTYFDNGIDKLYYTTQLGTDDTYNNGYLDSNTNLYIWEHNPSADKQTNGFIDIYKVNDMNEAYLNLSKIYSDFFIGNNKYYKKQMYDNNGYISYCIEDKEGNYYNSNNIVIPKQYFNNSLLMFPNNINCTNVNIENNEITINSFDDIKNLDFKDLIFNLDNKNVKIITKNNITYDDKFIVIGNRSNFDYQTFSNLNLNYNNIYTTEDDSGENSNIDIIANNKTYKWEYYKNIDGLGSINKLVESFKPNNCMDIYNVLNISNGNEVIYDTNGNSWNVECDNGKTTFNLLELRNQIQTRNLNSDSRYNFDNNNMAFTFFNNSNNEIVMDINIPINYNYVAINNFSIIDDKNEMKFLSGYDIKNLHTEEYYNILNNIKEKLAIFFSLPSSDTNYISVGLMNSNLDLLDEIGIVDNVEKWNFNNTFYQNSGKISLEFLFNNEDSTTNNILIDPSTTITVY